MVALRRNHQRVRVVFQRVVTLVWRVAVSADHLVEPGQVPQGLPEVALGCRQHRADGTHRRMVLRDNQRRLVHAEHVAERPDHARVGRDAALETDRRQKLFALADHRPEVPSHGLAQPGHDIVVGAPFLLEVNHVALGEDAAPPGNPRRVLALHRHATPLVLDTDAQPRGLLI